MIRATYYCGFRPASLAASAVLGVMFLPACGRQPELARMPAFKDGHAPPLARVVINEPAAIERSVAMDEAALEALARRDPRGALAHLLALPLDRATPHVLALYRVLATTAPHLIADSIHALVPDPLERQRIVEELLRPVLEADFDAGRRLLPCAVGPASRASALRDIACVWAATSLPDAIAWLREFPPGPERTAVAHGLLANWAVLDLPAATTWFVALPPEEQHHLLPHVIAPLAAHGPEYAARLLSEAGTDIFESHVRLLLGHWVKQDVTAAATWLASLDPRRQAYAGRVFARELLVAAPETATDWIRALPTASPLKAAAVVARYESLHRENPAAALTWLAEMTDLTRPEHRARLDATLETWLATDRPAALAWLRTTNLVK